MKDILNSLSFRNAYLMIYAPIILMIVDYVTGVLNAWLKKEIKSYKMRTGLAKKCGEIIAIGLGEFFSFVFSLPAGIMAWVSVYIIVMETISIFENLNKLGVPIPAFIKRAFEEAEKEMNKEKEEDHHGK